MAKILIADDSETLRAQLYQDLKAGGHDVMEAKNGVEALKSLKEQKGFDFCILDVNMPEMNGLEVVENLRKEGIQPNVQIFMLTTDSTPELKQQAKQLGVKAWITKPYNKDTLQKAIERLTLN